jgi:hypothetical protein
MGGTFVVLGEELEMVGKFMCGTLYCKTQCRSYTHRESDTLKINHKMESSGIGLCHDAEPLNCVKKFLEQFCFYEQVRKGFVQWN